MPAEMLIGRRLATGALRSAVDAAVGGAGGVVLLAGEAGDVARFARAAFGAHRVPTMTDSSRSGVIALLEEALAALDDQPPAVADGTAPAGTAGAHAARWLLSASLARELADGPDRDLSRAAGLARDAVEGRPGRW